jgi:hypothetical protein
LDYLTPDEIIQLTYYKEFFKFVEKQLEYEKKHKSKFFIENTNKFLKKNQNPYIEFNVWRNKILEIEPQKIDSLIKEYCIENQKNIKNFNKHQKLNLLDNHLGLRNAVWDFLTIKGEINALKLANLVKRMADAENLTIYKKNENNLFQQKENINELKILNK